jgi:hypothetical protein
MEPSSKRRTRCCIVCLSTGKLNEVKVKFSRNIERLVLTLMLVTLCLSGASPSYAKSATPTMADDPVQVVHCAGFLPSRLTIGQTGWVTPGAANRLRSWPYGPIIASLPGNAMFTVVGGPVCASRSTWWQVRYAGLIGWTAEGEGNVYYLTPSLPNNEVCFGALSTRLAIGRSGRVIPGTPNRLRALPDGVVMALIPGGATFRVVGGPRCGYRTVWWQVRYNGLTGWTREGSTYYWLEPR